MKDEGWEKVEVAPTWNPEEEPELIGVFLNAEENVGANNSMLYTFERPDGSRVGVWGSAILDSRMKNLTVGEEVKIVYKGKVRSERTGRVYKNFEVYHRRVVEK